MRGRFLRFALIYGAVAVAVPAAAQEAGGGDAEDVVITGSRIPRPDYLPGAPVYTVGPDEVAGDPSPSPAVVSLPPVLRAGMALSADPALGGTVNDLRGFGPSRQLVLVDGRRPPLSPADLTMDIAALPDALVDRVEVVGAGAAPAYGDQALAGAVNVRLKRDFAGIDVRAGLTGGGAGAWQTSIVAGGNFLGDKGHGVLAVDRAQRETLSVSAVPQLERRMLFGRLRYGFDSGVTAQGQATGRRYDAEGGGATTLWQGQAGLRGPLARTALLWEGTISAAGARTTVDLRRQLDQQAAELSANGDLRATRAGPLGVAFGLELRRQAYRVQGGAGGTTAAAAGWGEVSIPLAGDPWDARLELGLGYRRTQQDGQSADAWKVQLDWTPTDALRVRAAWQDNARMPTVLELYGVQRAGTRTLVGSPSLNPERGRSWSLGVVSAWTAGGRWLSRLRGSGEIHGMEITDAILAPEAGGAFANGGRIETRGVDMQLTWGFDLDWLGAGPGSGAVRAGLSAARLSRFEVRRADGGGDLAMTSASFLLAGGPEFSGSAWPGWRIGWSAGYAVGPWDLSVSGRYTGKVRGPLAADGRWTWDAAVARKIGVNLELRGGVYNLTDAAPPYAQADPTLYDPYGRRAFAQVRARF